MSTLAGQVVTFYSYKGGVGRTMALANVAVQLARWGYSVLCVDWDLEAPGLHLYFSDWLKNPPAKGLIDLVNDAAQDEKTQWRNYLIEFCLPPSLVNTVDKFHLLAAGSSGSDYVARVQNLDWTKLYNEHRLGTFIEGMRAEWKTVYDFVLIDSRTGLTDIGGICTVHLPDILVLLFTASRQSLDGIKEVARRAVERRNSLPVDRARLLCVPVPSRFDTRVEYAVSKEWLARFAAELQPLYEDWLHQNVSVDEIIAQLKLPYVPHWSYGERLPVLEESSRDPENLSYALETLSACIAHQVSHSELLARSRESFVASAPLPPSSQEHSLMSQFSDDIYLSATSRDSEFSNKFAAELRQLGLRVRSSALVEGSSGTTWSTAIEQTLRNSQHLVIFIGGESSTIQQHETSEFLKASLLDTTVERRVVPIRMGDVDSKMILPHLRDLQWLDGRGATPASLAADVSRRLGRTELKSFGGTSGAVEVETGQQIEVTHIVTFNDPHEEHGPFVSTRGMHSLSLPRLFRIAPVPVTNMQFLRFVEADGYDDDLFWPSLSRRSRRRLVCRDGRSLGPATWASSDGCESGFDSHPVTGVCYHEALAFVTWLNQVQPDPTWKWMLPTEDMWEISARGPHGFVYPWGNEFRPSVCNCAEEQIGTTSKVGIYAGGVGPFGTFDLAGNVWEFVLAQDQPDWACVLRGGSFVNNKHEVKSTLRLTSVPRNHRPPDFGFRCVQELYAPQRGAL